MMDRDELRRRLNGYEWTDLEVKEAARNVPRSAYETVSAFSNTSGGYLVFGVREANGQFEIVGVLDVDGVQNAFLSTLRSGQKTSQKVSPAEKLFSFEGKPVLIFYIPELPRSQKPLYLDHELALSYVRKAGCDFVCTKEELSRLLRDAHPDRYDGDLIDEPVKTCFDADTLRWYRGEFARQNSETLSQLTDLEFLDHCGLVRESEGQRYPLRAAVLLFGTAASINRVLPRPVVDFQVVPTDYNEEPSEERWSDRLIEDDLNLISTWRALLERFVRNAEVPFTLDSTTMQRRDQPPDYIAFREAAINLLVHQDYGDHSRKASIRLFRDRSVFFNPGDAFASAEQLLEAGEHEIRNPRVIKAFRRIGLSDQAGTGVRTIIQSWRRLGRVPPIIENDKAGKTFTLGLPRELLLTEQQILLQTQLGLQLDENEAVAFALALRHGTVSVLDLRKATGGTGSDVGSLARRLVTQVILKAVDGREAGPWRLAPHLAEMLGREGSTQTDHVALPAGDLVTDQATEEAESMATDQAPARSGNSDPAKPPSGTPKPLLLDLSETQRSILAFCESPRSMEELMQHLGIRHRAYFRKEHLRPLIEARLITLQFPDAPTHPRQKYLVSEAGLRITTKAKKDGR